MSRSDTPATACKIAPENFQAIVSEGIYDIDRSDAFRHLMDWLQENLSGYYLRDENSPFDCHLIEAEIFQELYLLTPPNTLGVLFQKVTKKR